MTAPLTAAELREIEEHTNALISTSWTGRDRYREDVPRLLATVKQLQAYRAACWVWEPEGDGGFDRVNAALAVFAVVRGLIANGRITLTDDDDPESFHEFLGRELLKAYRAESNAGLLPLNVAPVADSAALVLPELALPEGEMTILIDGDELLEIESTLRRAARLIGEGREAASHEVAERSLLEHADTLRRLRETVAAALPDPAHRCAVCKREWVDSDAGFDTCARCLAHV